MKSSQAGQPRNEALRNSTKTILENQINKRLTEAISFPPSLSPLPESDECSSEKIYISLVRRERAKDEAVNDVENGETIESIGEREERESHEIYKSYNTVIPRSHKYQKNAIRNRCRQFAEDFHFHGFPIGVKLCRDDLKYWIIALDLAHDKITVRQYLERLVMYGYFHLHKNGLYEFVRVLPEGQVTLLDPKIVRRKLNASLRPLRRTRRSF